MVRIEWLGHSCFKIDAGGYTVVIDPYTNGSVPGCPELRVSADMVLCSHSHGDHNAEANVALTGGKKATFKVTALKSYHDNAHGLRRGSNLIHIITGHDDDLGRDYKLVHAGDLGCMPKDAQLELMKGADVFMVPVGGFFTAEPEEIAKLVRLIAPTVVIPMHYRGDDFGYPSLRRADDYLALCGGEINYTDAPLTLENGMTPQTLMMSFKR